MILVRLLHTLDSTDVLFFKILGTLGTLTGACVLIIKMM